MNFLAQVNLAEMATRVREAKLDLRDHRDKRDHKDLPDSAARTERLDLGENLERLVGF